MGTKTCNNCNKTLTNRWQIKYCSNICQINFQYKNYIREWKKGNRNGNIGISVKSISTYLKKYLLEKKGEKCSKCGWDKKHPKSKRVPIEIDHIDGNSENNSENNLRLLCPNCHSLTNNFKNYNKGKGRKWRKEKYIKNTK